MWQVNSDVPVLTFRTPAGGGAGAKDKHARRVLSGACLQIAYIAEE